MMARTSASPAFWAAVPGVLAGCDPAAVPGRIRPIIVDPVELHSLTRATPHVGKEALDPGLAVLAEAPPVADVNPATAIVMIPGVGGVVASADAVLEGMRFACDVPADVLAVRDGPCLGDLGAQASAGRLHASAKVSAKNVNLVPAFAQAAPDGLAVLVDAVSADNGEASEDASLHMDGVVR